MVADRCARKIEGFVRLSVPNRCRPGAKSDFLIKLTWNEDLVRVYTIRQIGLYVHSEYAFCTALRFDPGFSSQRYSGCFRMRIQILGYNRHHPRPPQRSRCKGILTSRFPPLTTGKKLEALLAGDCVWTRSDGPDGWSFFFFKLLKISVKPDERLGKIDVYRSRCDALKHHMSLKYHLIVDELPFNAAGFLSQVRRVTHSRNEQQLWHCRVAHAFQPSPARTKLGQRNGRIQSIRMMSLKWFMILHAD